MVEQSSAHSEPPYETPEALCLRLFCEKMAGDGGLPEGIRKALYENRHSTSSALHALKTAIGKIDEA
jgi:hypothetical protein